MIRSIAAILSAPVHHHERHDDDGVTIEQYAIRPSGTRNHQAVATFAVIVMLAGVFALAPLAHGKGELASQHDLEPSLQSAALVMAVRVENVSPVQVVYGGKGTQTLYQYTLTPIRVLKGVYSRAELLITSADLQPYNYAFDPSDIRRGDQRLLLLGRSNVGYYGIRQGSTADELFPPVSGANDPLLGASAVLLAQQEVHDRLEIVGRLARELQSATGRGAIVLLAALDRRSDIAAQHEPAFVAVAHQLASDEAFVREAAAKVLGNLLDADYLANQSVRESAVASLVASLAKPTTLLAARVAAVQALASATDAVRVNDAAVRLIRLDAPYDTLAELSARLDVLGQLYENQQLAAEGVSHLLATLPLDASQYLQLSATQAIARIAADNAKEQLLDRLRRKKSLGLEAIPEIEAFGLILPKLTDPWPMQRALLGSTLTFSEQTAFVRICEDHPTPELIPALSTMLDPRQQSLRRMATDLLMKIDTRQAARAVQPHLAEETDLEYKLALAAFLGRHGFDDGYAYALEHMSDRRYLEAAVVAIAAIRKSGSADQLLDVYRNSNDSGWKQAAVRALGLLGHKPFNDELFVLTSDLNHPLAPAALQARADLSDMRVLELLPTALSFRNEAVVIAAARAAATLLPQEVNEQAPATTDIRGALADIASDSETALTVRQYALEALIAAEDPQLDNVLIAMTRDSRLEQTALLDYLREFMRERRLAI